jgi:hypothetical protein
VIVGDVFKIGYFVSTIGAVFQQTIAKYIDSTGTGD